MPKFAMMAAATLLLASGAMAAPPSPCKGKSESACSGMCGWTKGYTTKKGTKVAAFCRKKPVRAPKA